MSDLNAIQKERRSKTIFSWTGAGLLLGILLALNFIATYVSIRLDTSQGQVFSISKGTKLLLKDLQDPLLIRVMFSSKLPPQFKLNEKYIRDLLLEYKRASNGKVRIEYFDPGQSPKTKQQASEAGVNPVQLDVRERDRREVKECFMGISFLYQDKKDAIPLVQDTVGIEYEITQRIKKLVRPGEIHLGLVSSGEALTLTSKPLEPLQVPLAQLYTVQDVDLTKDIPAGLKALWLIGPTKELDAAAVTKLRDWVHNGGTLGMLLDHRDVILQSFQSGPLKTGLEPLLKEWGVDFKEGLVSDPRADRLQIRSTQGIFQMINLVDYPYFPLVTDMDREHPATKGIDAFSMPFVSPLTIEKEIPGLTYRVLAKSSPNSWLDASPYSVNPLQPKQEIPGSTKGPFNLALLIEGKFDSSKPDAKPGRVILFGSSRFINADYPPKPTNYTLFINMLDWSAQDEILLSIRSKGVTTRPLKELSDGIRIIVKYAIILALPFLSIIVGMVMWQRQKNRRALLPLLYTEV